MRILMMTNTYKPILGGVETSIESFQKALRKKGHEAVIVAPEYSGQPKKEKNVVRIPAIRNFNNTDFSVNLPVPPGFTKFVKRFAPDIIHSHHPFLIGDLALRMSQSHRIPIVFTYHTNFEDYTHYLPFDNRISKKFITQLSVGYANLCDLVIAPSESVRERLFGRGLRKPVNIVPTGVECVRKRRYASAVIRKKYRFPPQKRVLGYTGRLEPEKNTEFLSKAVARYLNSDRNACFVAVGGGSTKEDMEREFQKSGVCDRVCFTGPVSKKEAVKICGQFDVFVFASKSETQGIVILEAQSLGIPVVALDGPGVRECIADFKNGRLIKSAGMKDFSEAIRWCLNLKPKQLRKIRQTAKETAGLFSLENTADRLIRTYESIRYPSGISGSSGVLPWEKVMKRAEVEWRMMTNLSKSTAKAITGILETAPASSGPRNHRSERLS